jgi:tRNA(fMet)-specific endonuclease VapC
MIAFDADVLTRILAGDAAIGQKLVAVPLDQQSLPVVVVEEAIRGRLNSIRMAEAGKGKVELTAAYELFVRTLRGIQGMNVLPYTAAAHSLFQDWRRKKIRVGTHDLRIGAICVSTGVTLVTSNRRDFDQIPGLMLEIW